MIHHTTTRHSIAILAISASSLFAGTGPRSPMGRGLTPDGSGFMWGTSPNGGTSNFGTVFKVDISTGALTTLVQFNNTTAPGKAPVGGLTADGTGSFWGPTNAGGTHGYGTVFKVDQATGAFASMVHFTGNGATDKGNAPQAGLFHDGSGNLYGMTTTGGSTGWGTMYRVNASTGTLSTLFEFTKTPTTPLSSDDYAGFYPQCYAGVTPDSNGVLWGTTYGGNGPGFGTVFSYNSTTGSFDHHVHFNNTTVPGKYAYSGLTDDGLGYMWGVTYNGGTSNWGVIYKVSTTGGTFTPVIHFNNTTYPGKFPVAELAMDGNGLLWGSTLEGGVGYNQGTLFTVDPATHAFTHVLSFTSYGASNKGKSPYAALASDGAGNMWGTTREGGYYAKGTIFKVDESTGVLTTVYECN